MRATVKQHSGKGPQVESGTSGHTTPGPARVEPQKPKQSCANCQFHRQVMWSAIHNMLVKAGACDQAIREYAISYGNGGAGRCAKHDNKRTNLHEWCKRWEVRSSSLPTWPQPGELTLGTNLDKTIHRGGVSPMSAYRSTSGEWRL